MKKADVEIGGEYIAKVSGKLAVVKIQFEAARGGWFGINVKTGREIRIKSAQRLRRPAGGKYVITCNDRYLDGEPSWVTSRACAKRFSSVEDASNFFAQMSGNDITVDKGAKIEEVAI